ncbi:unnamed protein product [Ophioblennius macclurei]
MEEESRLSRQVERVERSVVFLRQEHLSLLHGLHLEILSLQKRCTELTGELKMKPPGRNHIELQEEEERLEARRREVEAHLSEQECTLGEIRKELSHKGALVGALRANLKEKERHFLEELKRRSHCSALLHAQLQQQTEAAAYLSFQLHAARQKLHRQRQGLRQGAQCAAAAAAEHNNFLCGAPPPSTSPLVVKPKRKSVRTAAARAERSRECVPVEKVTGPAEPTAMPDPALFLHPRRHRARPRPPPPPQRGEGGEEGGGEGLVEPLAPPAAQAEAD